jgi:hypothetical protein
MKTTRGYVERVRLHRFRSCLALSFLDVCDGGSGRPVKGETVYLSPAHVRQLTEEFARFLAESSGPFSGSSFGTVDIWGED